MFSLESIRKLYKWWDFIKKNCTSIHIRFCRVANAIIEEEIHCLILEDTKLTIVLYKFIQWRTDIWKEYLCFEPVFLEENLQCLHCELYQNLSPCKVSFLFTRIPEKILHILYLPLTNPHGHDLEKHRKIDRYTDFPIYTYICTHTHITLL
jgi:hypothetical protein